MIRARVGDVVVETDGDVLRATIDRPQARNAIDEGVLRGLEGTVEMARSTGCRVVVSEARTRSASDPVAKTAAGCAEQLRTGSSPAR